MKTLLSVLALPLAALTFQSCEVYPSSGYYGGRGYYSDSYYGGGGYGSTVVVTPGYREYHHGYRYSNAYYSRESGNVNRHVHIDRNVHVNRNVHANRGANVNRNVHVNRNLHINRNVHHQ